MEIYELFIKRQTSGTSSDNEWQWSDNDFDNKWQGIDDEWYNEWQQVTTSGTTSDNK